MNTSHNPQLRLRPNGQKITGALSIFTALSLFALPATSLAQQTNPEATDNNDVIAITVEGQAEQIGKFALDREQINIAPSSTGTLEEALRARSSIQFDQNSRNSMLGGEITPPKVSIAGGRYYENNFLVDGISISNNLNPSSFNSSTSDGIVNAPAGEAANFFLDPDLVGLLTVYTSNVPAEYGAFTGGVISAKIRDPRTDRFHFSASYRHTRDSWARQHFIPGQYKEHSTNAATYQPEFTKDEYSMSIEGPLSKRIAALLSYSEKRSVIPVYDTTNRAEKHDTTRINRNLLFKLSARVFENFKTSLTTGWTPYESEYFAQAQRRNSDYTSKGGGYYAQLDTENILSAGILETTLAFNHSDSSRDGEGNAIYTWRNSGTNAYANWGTSTTAMEGFAGDYTQTKNQFTLKPTFSFNTFGFDWLVNKVKIGAEVSHQKFKADHVGEEMYMWSGNAVNGPYNTAAVGELKDGVVTGEQWLNRRVSYAPWHKSLDVTQASFFAEDIIQIERVTFRPGVRISYDDISDNVDIAPRTFLNIDIFKNNLLNISTGYNRYYGTQIVSWSMYNNQGFSTETRTAWDQPWTLVSGPTEGTSRSLGDLKSPYNDEFSLGAELNIWKTAFRVEAVKRNHRDQIRAVPDSDGTGSNARKYANGGKTNYEGLNFEIEKRLTLGWAGKHDILFTATWSETKTTFRSDVGFSEEANAYSLDYAMYNGKIVLKSSMPPNNFNNPWVLTLNDTMRFYKDRLRLYNNLRFEKGGDGVFYVGILDGVSPDGLRVYEYIDGHQADSFYYDVSIEFDLIKHRISTLTLRLEILNVFDRKNLTNTTQMVSNSSSDTYMMGRQFFAGMRFHF